MTRGVAPSALVDWDHHQEALAVAPRQRRIEEFVDSQSILIAPISRNSEKYGRYWVRDSSESRV
jgi:hypothetical protein